MADAQQKAMRKVEQEEHDFYSGSLDELAALGFMPREAFPGQPGRPLTSVSIRPAGVTKPKNCWHREPGYISVSRTASGRYQMCVAVSELEQRRRLARREASELEKTAEQGKAKALAEQISSGRFMVEAAFKMIGREGVEAILRELDPPPRRHRAHHLHVAYSAPSSPR
jgi:hypothetical protein